MIYISYLKFVFLSVDNHSCDLLIQEYQDSGKNCRHDCQYGQPPVFWFHSKRIHNPVSVYNHRILQSYYMDFTKKFYLSMMYIPVWTCSFKFVRYSQLRCWHGHENVHSCADDDRNEYSKVSKSRTNLYKLVIIFELMFLPNNISSI